MIGCFQDVETQLVFCGERSRKLPFDIQQTARRKLRILNRVTSPLELRVPPGNRLEELKGNRTGTYSIRITDQWRITFRWVDGGTDDVRIEDYHRG